MELPITSQQLRSKRMSAGITGAAVCLRTGIARSRLSDIERGYATPRPDELARILSALDLLATAKQRIDALASELGWPGVGMSRAESRTE